MYSAGTRFNVKYRLMFVILIRETSWNLGIKVAIIVEHPWVLKNSLVAPSFSGPAKVRELCFFSVW